MPPPRPSPSVPASAIDLRWAAPQPMMSGTALPLACAATRPLAGRRYRCGHARRALRRWPRRQHRLRAGQLPLHALEFPAERLILGTSGREIPFEDAHLMSQVADLRLQRRFVLLMPLVALLRLAHQVVERLLSAARRDPLAIDLEQRTRLASPQPLLGQFAGRALLLEFGRKIPSCLFRAHAATRPARVARGAPAT